MFEIRGSSVPGERDKVRWFGDGEPRGDPTSDREPPSDRAPPGLPVGREARAAAVAAAASSTVPV